MTLSPRLRRYTLIVLGPSLLAGAAGAAFFELRGSYTAEASFVADDSPMGAAGLAGIASQLGVNLPVSATGRPVDYYTALLRSPTLVIEMARSRYAVPQSRDSLTLFQLHRFADDTSGRSVRKMLLRLDSRIAVSSNRRSGVVSLAVKAPYPSLAQQMARRLVELVNEYNQRSLQSRAAAERRFVAERLEQAGRELRQAEAAVENFLSENRSYAASPRLVFRLSSLQREMEARQQVYMTLMRSHEQARIEAVRNTPVISVLQRPDLYWRKTRNPVAMGAGAFVVVAAGIASLIMVLEWLATGPQGSPPYVTVAAARIVAAVGARQSQG